jgi:fatty-acyl-CoA synthase
MELYQLRYFVELARQRSFTRAAKRLDLAKPALSVQIQKLEEELGSRLFVRGQKQTVLTPAGEILFVKAQSLLSMADSMKQSVAEVTELRAGRLSAAFVPALGTYWLPEIFQRFRRKFPCVRLALEEDDSMGVAARVEDSSAELGFLELPVNDQLFEIEKVWEEPVLAMLPGDHPLAGKDNLKLNQLAQEAFVVQRGPSHQQTLEVCRRAGFEPRLGCDCSDKETAIALVQAGLGVMLLPLLAANGRGPNLAVVPIREPKLVHQFGLICRRGHELSAAANAFVELVKKSPFPRGGASAEVPAVRTPGAKARRTATTDAPDARSPLAEVLLTPLKFLVRSSHVYGQKVAIIDGAQSTTYAGFGQRVNQLAAALRRADLTPGGRVAFLCPNTQPMLEAHFGVPLAGGVLVPINLRLTPGEIACVLNHSGAEFLFADSELAAALRPVCDHLDHPMKLIDIQHERRAKPAGDASYEDFLQAGSTKPVAWSLKDEADLISLNYTSGTTGRPKGVMITHRGAYLNALGNIIELGLTEASRLLWTLPMYHCNGWGMTWAATAVGATHICLRRFEPAAVWKLIADHRVSHLCGSPSILAQLINHPGRPAKLREPLTVFVGGAPPSGERIMQWDAAGARVVHGYGLTETCGGYAVCQRQSSWDGATPAERVRLLLRQGVPLVTGDPLRVVDEQMRDVPADGQTIGEVIMRGTTVMAGYYKEPEATARDFKGGWFHSGDLAVMRPDGYLELRDRRRDVIIYDGEHFSSIEVEQILYQHPGVAEAAVVGVPDSTHGEVPKAFVVRERGANVAGNELISFCRAHLAGFKCPVRVEFVSHLPKTSTGKLQKFLLREREWAGQEKRICGV